MTGVHQNTHFYWAKPAYCIRLTASQVEHPHQFPLQFSDAHEAAGRVIEIAKAHADIGRAGARYCSLLCADWSESGLPTRRER
jgi:hypothetical protein